MVVGGGGGRSWMNTFDTINLGDSLPVQPTGCCKPIGSIGNFSCARSMGLVGCACDNYKANQLCELCGLSHTSSLPSLCKEGHIVSLWRWLTNVHVCVRNMCVCACVTIIRQTSYVSYVVCHTPLLYLPSVKRAT